MPQNNSNVMSIRGDDGTFQPVPAIKGDSAYEVAVSNGFKGTEQEWLDSLHSDVTYIPVTMTGETISSNMVSSIDHPVVCNLESKNILNPEITYPHGNGEALGIKYAYSGSEFSAVGTFKLDYSTLIDREQHLPADVYQVSILATGTVPKYCDIRLGSNKIKLQLKSGVNVSSLIMSYEDMERIKVAFVPNAAGDAVDFTFKLQLEKGFEATSHTPYISDFSTVTVTRNPGEQTFKPLTNGEVTGMISTSPNMNITTDNPGVILHVTYNADTKKYMDYGMAEKLSKAPIGAATPDDTQEVHLTTEGKLVTKSSGAVDSVNGRTGDIILKLGDLDGDATHRTVTDIQIAGWDNKQDAGDYATTADLDSKLDKSPIGAATPDDTQEVHLTPEGKLVTAPGGGGSAVEYDGDGYHNSVYRGKNLGSAVTSEQYARINDGTFRDLFIGDYWTINGVDWIIAAFNYYKGTGSPKPVFSKNHVLIVPKENLYKARMEPTPSTSTAYAGSEMRASGLNEAKEIINAAFPNHVLTKRSVFVNSSTSGYPQGGAWYDSDVDLMNERQIFGNPINSNTNYSGDPPYASFIDTTQLPLFRYNRDLITTSSSYWLRDITSGPHHAKDVSFITVSLSGFSGYHYCNEDLGVRPAFIIG